MYITINRLSDSIIYPFLFSLDLSAPPHLKTVCVCLFVCVRACLFYLFTSSCEVRPSFSFQNHFSTAVLDETKKEKRCGRRRRECAQCGTIRAACAVQVKQPRGLCCATDLAAGPAVVPPLGEGELDVTLHADGGLRVRHPHGGHLSQGGG